MKFLFKQSSALRFLQRAELCLPLIFLRSSETYVSLEFMQNSESEGKNGLYELGVLIVPSISEDVARSVFSDIMEILSKHGAVKTSDNPVLRELAYEMTKTSGGKISHFTSAYFGSIIFEAENSLVGAIKNEIEKQNDVLRLLIIKTTSAALVPRERRVSGRIDSEKFKPEKLAPKAPLSEAELDKTIEALVV